MFVSQSRNPSESRHVQTKELTTTTLRREMYRGKTPFVKCVICTYLRLMTVYASIVASFTARNKSSCVFVTPSLSIFFPRPRAPTEKKPSCVGYAKSTPEKTTLRRRVDATCLKKSSFRSVVTVRRGRDATPERRERKSNFVSCFIASMRRACRIYYVWPHKRT